MHPQILSAAMKLQMQGLSAKGQMDFLRSHHVNFL
jgi:hypothetical protein